MKYKKYYVVWSMSEANHEDNYEVVSDDKVLEYVSGGWVAMNEMPLRLAEAKRCAVSYYKANVNSYLSKIKNIKKISIKDF